MKLIHLAIACAGLAATPLTAHEFWVDPIEFQVEKDAPVAADLRNGELFEGTRQSFFEDRNTRAEAVMGDDIAPITGRMGDRPALQLPAPGRDGLLILLHETTASRLTYKTWEKFMKFAAHKDFPHAAPIHEERGWAKEDFVEVYTRHSKALIAVGDGAGADRAFGLATEFVALENPYAPDFDGTLDVALLFEGAPRADAQIEVYERTPDDEVTLTVIRTDADGHAAVPTTQGMEYLLDAVVLRPLAGATTVENGPVWETLWAAMTFATRGTEQ